ncbi:hypothetical protein [Yersinia aldovae]|uniref:hypothetical protein n=1 Tax=Yersinia aldovae TaxID=29483 RepID=UPI00119FD9A3|nr:hypothetical protein [Yersinia aldovae]
MKKTIVGLLIISTMGCTSPLSPQDNLANAHKLMNEKTDIVVYVPVSDIQRYDGAWINEDNLKKIQSMTTCPPSKNPYSFQYKAEVQDDGVHVIVNRDNCVVDTTAVKKYLDESIINNQMKANERFEEQRRQREVSPAGPFVMGCRAYQATFKGSEVVPVSLAINMYPKINSEYVRNLYRMGFTTASYYQPNADCEYLAAIRGIR